MTIWTRKGKKQEARALGKHGSKYRYGKLDESEREQLGQARYVRGPSKPRWG
jgi:hypothetical protein